MTYEDKLFLQVERHDAGWGTGARVKEGKGRRGTKSCLGNAACRGRRQVVWKDQCTGRGSREMKAQGGWLSRHGCVGVRKLAGGRSVTARALASDFPRREPCSLWSSTFLSRPLSCQQSPPRPTSATTVSLGLLRAPRTLCKSCAWAAGYKHQGCVAGRRRVSLKPRVEYHILSTLHWACQNKDNRVA
jgi:hypothetical protein